MLWRSFLATIALFWTLTAAHAEEFVVIHVEPAVPDLVAGAVYGSEGGSPEFVFVPSGVKVALLGEDGTSYIVEGRAAVEASHDGLAGFRVPADQENDEGLLARMFGVAGLSETTAAGRAIPNDKRGQVDEAEPGARLPLFIEFLPKLAEGGTFCLFSDSLFVRRIDSRFLDRIRVEVGGRTLEEDLKPGAIALRFTGLGIGENEKVKLTLATKRDVHEIAVQRLPAGVLEGSNFDRVARLAKHGCTLQALMAAEGADGKAE